MVVRQIISRLEGRLRRPLVSVVIPCKDGEQFIENAVRSALNQSLRQLEVIVVDDCSTDNTRTVVESLGTRDRRVRLISGRGMGPGAARNDAVSVARGRYLTFIDADDKVLPGAFEDMATTLVRTKSDYVMGGYLRHGTAGTHRPNIVAAVHGTDRIGTNVEEFPQLLEEPVLWNKMFCTSFWRSSVGSIPEDVNYEDQEPCLRAALAASSIDILARDTYSWRLPEGRASRSQTKAEIKDLQDRGTIIRRMLDALDGASANVVQHILATWLGRDLGLYAPHAFSGVPSYQDRLRGLAKELAERMDRGTWAAMPFWDRLTAWALAYGTPHDLAEAVASRLEDTSAVPITRHAGRLTVSAPVLTRVSDASPILPLVGPNDLRLRAEIKEARQEKGAIVFEGTAYVPGLSEDEQPEVMIELIGAPIDRFITLERRDDPDADYEANDPWRSYTGLGYRATYPSSFSPVENVRFSATLDGHELVSVHAMPPVTQMYTHGILVDRFEVNGSMLEIAGRHDVEDPIDVVLSSSAFCARPKMTVTDDTWCAQFDLADPYFPSGGYFLRWGRSGSDSPEGWCRIGRLDKDASYHLGPIRRAELRFGRNAEVGCTIGPPLARLERSSRGQRVHIESTTAAGHKGVFFESFNGKSGGDSPAAILTDLVKHDMGEPLWWSALDGTVPVPDGARRVIVGSADWFKAVRTAKVLVSNNNFPHWFEKSPEQYLIQTWHGTPIKRLLFDAPEAFIPLTYRRLMARQVPQWNLLLAQSENAAMNLRSSTGYTGEVYIGEYPRNARLLSGESGAARVRESLGLAEEERVVLYAPTWRDSLRPQNSRVSEDLLDVEALAKALDVTILARSHHMNSLRSVGKGVKDVSHYPHIEDLFLISDVFVSDYSSAFYDFTLTGRPAVIYAPDLKWYKEVERGFYDASWPQGTPWPLTQSLDELIEVLHSALSADRVPLVQPFQVERSLAWIRSRISDVLASNVSN